MNNETKLRNEEIKEYIIRDIKKLFEEIEVESCICHQEKGKFIMEININE